MKIISEPGSPGELLHNEPLMKRIIDDDKFLGVDATFPLGCTSAW